MNDNQIDCKPDDEDVFPTNREFCDGKDNNCDNVLYPSNSQCFTLDTQANACLIGNRQCEDDGGIGWHDCVVESQDPGDQVPMELCSAYAACDALGEADPFQCALDDVSVTEMFACVVFHDVESNVCPSAEVSLPNTASESCSWALLGGQSQAHYDAYLRALGDVSGSATSVNACDAVFGIDSALDVPPQPDRFLLWQRVNTTSAQFLRIDVTPQQVLQCPVQGLQCVGLVPPADVNPN